MPFPQTGSRNINLFHKGGKFDIFTSQRYLYRDLDEKGTKQALTSLGIIEKQIDGWVAEAKRVTTYVEVMITKEAFTPAPA